MLKILLAEDSEYFAEIVTKLLEDNDCEVVHVPNARDGFATIAACEFDAVVTDVRMPYGDGMEVIQMVYRQKRVRGAYMHSTEESYSIPGSRGEKLHLPDVIPSAFKGFAEFHLKDVMNTELPKFLAKVQAQKAA